MNIEITSALIALIGSLFGTFAGIVTSSKLTSYRLAQLEQKVDKHNNVIERVYKLEKQDALREEEIRVANHRIKNLEVERRGERCN